MFEYQDPLGSRNCEIYIHIHLGRCDHCSARFLLTNLVGQLVFFDAVKVDSDEWIEGRHAVFAGDIGVLRVVQSARKPRAYHRAAASSTLALKPHRPGSKNWKQRSMLPWSVTV